MPHIAARNKTFRGIRRLRWMIFGLLLVLMTFGGPRSAYAISCGGWWSPKYDPDMATADAVFQGRIVFHGPHTLLVAVDRSWKGVTARTVTVTYNRDNATILPWITTYYFVVERSEDPARWSAPTCRYPEMASFAEEFGIVSFLDDKPTLPLSGRPFYLVWPFILLWLMPLTSGLVLMRRWRRHRLRI